MGKQYISTVSASKAHKSDIYGVEITSKYTISISSDGYAKFWDNKKDEVHQPTDFVQSLFINASGIHHLSVYENKIPSSTVQVTILAFACFNGEIFFKYYINGDFARIKDIAFKLEKCWIPGFYVDPENKQDFFLVTKMNGVTEVYTLSIESKEEEEEEEEVSIKFEKYGDLGGSTTTGSSRSWPSSSFSNSLSVNQTENKKCAVGHMNGNVLLYDFQTLKLVYTFKSTDLVVSRNPKLNSSSSVPRALAFSPGGTLLAVARDNQAAGSITLYDVQYGENVGTLATPSHSAKSVVGGFAHQGWIMGLDFDETGKNLVSCGFDKCVRVWDLDTREREATINISISDFDDTTTDQQDESIASGVKFIKKGIRGGAGGDNNDGICVVSFDRGIRWYREAGGI
ncbi:SKI8 [Candida oxycetoniae]|uniref:SKI8 n=1 Tax=Candida oxycetoniae TaxID=497107 RepID=A0AAI9SY15_9ASCO|nr:SKI8 [Candida oxycetoniae]KAI3404964.1 SKI8 [Candida oxycetoniae]